MSLLPTPGSLEARVDGCSCPPVVVARGFPLFSIAAGCRVHDTAQVYATPAVEGLVRDRTDTYAGGAA